MTDIGYSVTPPPIKCGGQYCYTHCFSSCNFLIHLHNFLVILIDGIEADVLAVLAIFFAQLLITPELLDLLLQVRVITALK